MFAAKVKVKSFFHGPNLLEGSNRETLVRVVRMIFMALRATLPLLEASGRDTIRHLVS